MAGFVYLKLKGAKQGDIKGSSAEHTLEREDSIECTSFSLPIVSPRDRATGLASGRRYYEPIRFVKNFDKATPCIASAIVMNEMIERAEFKFFDVVNGTEALIYTILAENGAISAHRQFVSDTLDPASASRPPQEEVSLVFKSITGTWADGPVSWHDTWGAGT
jgi:type VI secretion system secreted protein Hcp